MQKEIAWKPGGTGKEQAKCTYISIATCECSIFVIHPFSSDLLLRPAFKSRPHTPLPPPLPPRPRPHRQPLIHSVRQSFPA